jgi:hypothetical protein
MTAANIIQSCCKCLSARQFGGRPGLVPTPPVTKGVTVGTSNSRAVGVRAYRGGGEQPFAYRMDLLSRTAERKGRQMNTQILFDRTAAEEAQMYSGTPSALAPSVAGPLAAASWPVAISLTTPTNWLAYPPVVVLCGVMYLSIFMPDGSELRRGAATGARRAIIGPCAPAALPGAAGRPYALAAPQPRADCPPLPSAELPSSSSKSSMEC